MFNCNNCLHRAVCPGYQVTIPDCQQYKDESRFVELPCKVGDTIYRKGRFSNTIVEASVQQITINGFGLTFKAAKGDTIFSFNDDDIGQTVFLTREEAEQALKEGKENA